MSQDCLFCHIASGATHTPFLLENDRVVVFRDRFPAAPVHLLIVPRLHIRSINDITPEHGDILADLILTGREMARRESVFETGYKLLFNVERGGGQTIFHVHLHLVGGWKGAVAHV